MDLPSFTGLELIALFRKDGWSDAGRRTHGLALQKRDHDGRVRTVIIPTKSKRLPDQTLGAILSVKQSGIGRKGLEEMVNRRR